MSIERTLNLFGRGAVMMGLASLLACTSPISSGNGKNNKSSGCVRDSDCKGNRICVKGECVDDALGANNYPSSDKKDVYDQPLDVSDMFPSQDSSLPKDSYVPQDVVSFDSGFKYDSWSNYDNGNNNGDSGNNFQDLNDNYDSFLGCNSNEFQCNSGKCIPQSYLCDGGAPDCPGGEDEYNCFKKDAFVNDPGYDYDNGSSDVSSYPDYGLEDVGGCSPSDYQCNNGMCIPQGWLCDGANDCPSGEDEFNCYSSDAGSSDAGSSDSSSSCFGFLCYDGECKPASYQCDGANDCSSGEDEYGCPPMQGQLGGACGFNEDCNSMGVAGTFSFCLTDAPLLWTNGNCATGSIINQSCSSLEQSIGKPLVDCVSKSGVVTPFGSAKFCLPECSSDSECRADYYCGYGNLGALDCAGKVCLPK